MTGCIECIDQKYRLGDLDQQQIRNARMNYHAVGRERKMRPVHYIHAVVDTPSFLNSSSRLRQDI
jgi:hypothetical protein